MYKILTRFVACDLAAACWSCSHLMIILPFGQYLKRVEFLASATNKNVWFEYTCNVNAFLQRGMKKGICHCYTRSYYRFRNAILKIPPYTVGFLFLTKDLKPDKDWEKKEYNWSMYYKRIIKKSCDSKPMKFFSFFIISQACNLIS